MVKLSSGQGIRLALSFAAIALFVGFAPTAHAAAANSMIICVSDTDFGCFGGAGNGIFAEYSGGAITSGHIGSGMVSSASTIAGSNLLITGSLGIFSINIDSGLFNTPGAAMDLSVQNTSSGAGTLYVAFGADNYTTGGPFNLNASLTSFSGVTSLSDTACFESGNGSYFACTAPANGETLVPAGSVIGSATATSTSGFSFSSSVHSPTNPFGLEQDIKVVFGGAGTVSGDLGLVSVPEPTSILLLGGALALAGRSLRKKYQKA